MALSASPFGAGEVTGSPVLPTPRLWVASWRPVRGEGMWNGVAGAAAGNPAVAELLRDIGEAVAAERAPLVAGEQRLVAGDEDPDHGQAQRAYVFGREVGGEGPMAGRDDPRDHSFQCSLGAHCAGAFIVAEVAAIVGSAHKREGIAVGVVCGQHQMIGPLGDVFPIVGRTWRWAPFYPPLCRFPVPGEVNQRRSN